MQHLSGFLETVAVKVRFDSLRFFLHILYFECVYVIFAPSGATD